MSSPIQLDRHRGYMEDETGRVVFYKLIFDNILNAAAHLKYVPPGAYQGWVHGDKVGIHDFTTNRYFVFGYGWIDEQAFRDLCA